jgi:Polysaccharide biosynthesis/export protein
MANVPPYTFRNYRKSESIMRKLPLAFFVVVFLSPCFSQSLNDPLSQGTTSQGTIQGTAVDCSDPSMAATPLCSAAQAQRSGSTIPGRDNSSPMRTPVLTNGEGFNIDQYTPSRPPLNPSQIWHPQIPTRPETEFEQMVADSVGRALPLFGQSLFVQAPSTFSPVDWMQVPSDYIIGPGDELQIRVWGQVEANLRVIVDRSGQIYIPQVGQVSVAGIRGVSGATGHDLK